MKKYRIIWALVIIVAVAVVVAMSIPGSPLYLPELVVQGGVYEGKSTRHWISQLDSADVEQRKEAVTAIASIGPDNAGKAVPKLGKLVAEDPDREVRNEAALALTKMAPRSREVVNELIKAVEDKEAPVRLNAVRALLALKADAKPAIPVLIKAMHEKRNLTNVNLFANNIQEFAVLALGAASAGTGEGVPHVIEYLKKADTSYAKDAAIRAIGAIGPEARSAEPLLTPYLKSNHQMLREAAADALKRIGAPVPDVGPVSNDTPPANVGGRSRYPSRPGLGPNSPPDQSKPTQKEKPTEKEKDKAKPAEPDEARPAEPDKLELAVAEREYIWDIEHQGNVLAKHGLGPLCDALKRADADALGKLLADDFKGGDLNQPERVAAANEVASAERLRATGPATAITKQAFVARLMEARKLFAAVPPSVKLAQVKLGPKKRGELDGLWEGSGQLRLHGEYAKGAPAEVVIHLRYEIAKPTEETLAKPGWLRSAEVTQIQTVKAPHYLFREVARERGLDPAKLHDNWTTDGFIPMTGGIYVCDFNRDGILDVLVTDLKGVFLYRGRPDGTFEDVTTQVGLSSRPIKSGATAWIDIDGDGWEDLILAGQVYRNEGGRFVDYSSRCDLRLPLDTVNLVVADYNRDGKLDIYATRNGKPGSGSWMDGKIDDANGNYLFRNNGNWQFEDVTRSANAVGGRRSTFTAAWLDADDDGWPDLYVINEFGNGVLLLNNRDGTFREQLLADRPADFGSMGVAVGDINNDGRIDIYSANMYSKAGMRVIGNLAPDAYASPVMERMRRFVAGSQLHLNKGRLKFDQVGASMQVAGVGWAYGACLADLDNDGWLDLYATAGYISRDRDKPDG